MASLQELCKVGLEGDDQAPKYPTVGLHCLHLLTQPDKVSGTDMATRASIIGLGDTQHATQPLKVSGLSFKPCV